MDPTHETSAGEWILKQIQRQHHAFGDAIVIGLDPLADRSRGKRDSEVEGERVAALGVERSEDSSCWEDTPIRLCR